MKDVLAAMKKIKESGALFISRGDDSGTNKMELGYWKELGIDPKGEPISPLGRVWDRRSPSPGRRGPIR